VTKAQSKKKKSFYSESGEYDYIASMWCHHVMQKRVLLKLRRVVIFIPAWKDHQKKNLVVKQVSVLEFVLSEGECCSNQETETDGSGKEESSEESTTEEEESSSTDAGEVLANLKKKFSKKPQPKGTTILLMNATIAIGGVSESESEETSSEESSTEESDSDEPEQRSRPQVKKQHSQRVWKVIVKS